MQAAPKSRLTGREYLALERNGKARGQCLNGELFVTAGGTRRHSRIAVNIASTLNAVLRGNPCEAFNSDMRLQIVASVLHTFPDAQVACGQLRFEDDREDTLIHPKVIVEGAKGTLPLKTPKCRAPLTGIYRSTGLKSGTHPAPPKPNRNRKV